MEFDCVVVGGGLVGMTFALMLRQLNYRVLIVEKNASIPLQEDFQARTIALSYASQQMFKQLGIGEKLASCVVPIKKVAVTVKGEFGSSTLKSSDVHLPDLGGVANFYQLESSLSTAFLQLAPTDLMLGATVNEWQVHPQGWHLTVVCAEQRREMTTRLVVAADGMHSSLRRLLSIPVRRHQYNHYAIIANVQVEGGTPFTAIERFLNQGAIALLPWRQNYMTCVWTVSAAEKVAIMRLAAEDFLKACQQQLGRRYGKLVACATRVCVPLQMQIAAQQSAHRCLLLGNAAHLLHPIAAQGLNLSLRDIWQIRRQVLQSPAIIDLGTSHFIAAYLRQRAADQQRVIFATDKIARFMSGGPLPPALRATGLTLFDCLAPLKKSFTRYSLGLA